MLPPYASPALARAMEQINRAFGGRVVPLGPASPPAHPYSGPVYTPHPQWNAATRRRNLSALDAKVEAWRDYATGMGSEGRAWLDERAVLVDSWLGLLACGETPKWLVGLDAFDLANARDRLCAEVG